MWSGAFNRCYNFNQPMVFPNSISTLDNVFEHCWNYNQPTTFGSQTLSLNNAFYNCKNMAQNITILSNRVQYICGFLNSKNNSKRVNIIIPAGNTTETTFRNTSAQYSVTSTSISWTNDASNNCFYNTKYNIYIYNTL